MVNHALDRLVTLEPDSTWWRGARERILADTFSRTLEHLSGEFGPDPGQWRWDQVHSVHFKHELDGAVPLLDGWLSRGPIPGGGGHPVLGRAGYRYDKPFTGRSGATVRVIVDMAPGNNDAFEVRTIIPGGQHGHPSSPYYDDQIDSWLNGELDALAESPEAVSGATTYLIPLP